MVHFTGKAVSCDITDSHKEGATLSLKCVSPSIIAEGKMWGGESQDLHIFLDEEQLDSLIAQLSGKYYVRKAMKATVVTDAKD
jgi:hypothetical protein